MSNAPLAKTDDVVDVWRPLSDTTEAARIERLIAKASARLRQKCAFDIDARIALFQSGAVDPTALDPQIVADVVAAIVKRFLVNQDGVASNSQGAGPFSQAQTFVSRYDKSGADVRGTIQVTEADLEQLRPAVPAPTVGVVRVDPASPRVVIPHTPFGRFGLGGPVVVPDLYPDSGVE